MNGKETESDVEYIQRRIKFEEAVLKELKEKRSELIIKQINEGKTLDDICQYWSITPWQAWQTIYPAFKEGLPEETITITKGF